MDPLENIRQTLLACCCRIKGIGIFVKGTQEQLLRETRKDPQVKQRIEQVAEGSAALAGKMEELLALLGDKTAVSAPAAVSRRQEERFAVDGEATLVIDSAVKKTYLLRNLSRTGIGIVGSHPLEKGEKVDVVVVNPVLKKSVYEGSTVQWGNRIDKHLWVGGIALKNGDAKVAA